MKIELTAEERASIERERRYTAKSQALKTAIETARESLLVAAGIMHNPTQAYDCLKLLPVHAQCQINSY